MRERRAARRAVCRQVDDAHLGRVRPAPRPASGDEPGARRALRHVAERRPDASRARSSWSRCGAPTAARRARRRTRARRTPTPPVGRARSWSSRSEAGSIPARPRVTRGAASRRSKSWSAAPPRTASGSAPKRPSAENSMPKGSGGRASSSRLGAVEVAAGRGVDQQPMRVPPAVRGRCLRRRSSAPRRRGSRPARARRRVPPSGPTASSPRRGQGEADSRPRSRATARGARGAGRCGRRPPGPRCRPPRSRPAARGPA